MHDPPRLDDPDPGIATDLRATFGAWRTAPMLVVATLAVHVGGELLANLGWVFLVGFAVTVPWSGVERVWYLRAFHGKGLTASEVVRLVLDFFGRFLRLWLTLLLPLSVVVLVASLVSRDQREPLTWVGLVLIGIVVSVGLTFVTPALAFSTRSVRRAFRIGLETLRDTWPACAPYVLLPLVAWGVWFPFFAFERLRVLRGIGAVAWALVLSPLIGATARFYLRRSETYECGAVPIGPEDSPADPKDEVGAEPSETS